MNALVYEKEYNNVHILCCYANPNGIFLNVAPAYLSKGVIILRPEQAARHENDIADNNWTSSSKHLSELKRNFEQSSERSSSKYDSKWMPS